MNTNFYFKYYLLLLLTLHVSSFNLINLFKYNAQFKSSSVKYVKMFLNTTNSYLDSLNNNNNKLINIKTNKFQNMKLSSNGLNTNKINSNTLIFNIYKVDKIFVDKNFTQVRLNLRTCNSSVYYINNNNNEIEQIISSSQLTSNKIKHVIFTDLNNIMNDTLGLIYEDI
jgi:hypothetical protein